MIRRPHLELLVLVIGCLTSSFVSAQVSVSPAIARAKPATPADVVPEVITLYAMDQPDPMLRYRFWPAPEKRSDANAAPLVSRAVILSLQVPPDHRKRLWDRLADETWATDIKDFPVDEVRELLGPFQPVFTELERATNRMQTRYDLQLEHLNAAELLQTVLPEIQEMRSIGRLLSLRIRLAIAEQRWDDVVTDCRCGFRMAEIAGRSTDFLIGRLVGFSISAMMFSTIQEAIGQPGCPNLYWALASLPDDRLFETRSSIEYESLAMSRVFQAASELPEEPIGEDQARELIREMLRQSSVIVGPDSKQTSTSQLAMGLYVMAFADSSRELLAARPEWGAKAHELSAIEAVLRAATLRFTRDRDRWLAWSFLPDDNWSEYQAEREATFRQAGHDPTDVLSSLVMLLAPAVEQAYQAGRRTIQQRNLLITLEALRMYAAQNQELPPTLDRLRPTPAWNDAVAMQPFGYQRTSATTATLTRAPRWRADSGTTIQIQLKGTH
jgi:hypothetical protein